MFDGMIIKIVDFFSKRKSLFRHFHPNMYVSSSCHVTVVTLYVLTNDDKMMMEGLMRLICLLGIFIRQHKEDYYYCFGGGSGMNTLFE